MKYASYHSKGYNLIIGIYNNEHQTERLSNNEKVQFQTRKPGAKNSNTLEVTTKVTTPHFLNQVT